jgi:hypothetical protein
MKPMRRSITSRLFTGSFTLLNRFVEWHRLPRPLAILNLIALRTVLRAENLHDTSTPAAPSGAAPATEEEIPAFAVSFRTADGRFNDLEHPDMGKAGARFARNFPLEYCFPETGDKFLSPNPRDISNELLARKEFVPAEILNILAAAWIQFQTHDWFNHGRSKEERIEIPLKSDDPWPERPMQVPRTPRDPTRTDADKHLPPTYVNTETHWWDGSAVYGSSEQIAAGLRTFEDGKMVVQDGRLPLDSRTGLPLTGFNENWWVGLGLLHTLFTLEHNAICDSIRSVYSSWSDERIHQTAKLVNSALMAKIHTVEWTTAILPNHVLQKAMHTNWWGLAGHRARDRWGRIGESEILSGIPGSETHHHGAPFALTEEFTTVYRLHPLIPDQVALRSAKNGALVREASFKDLALKNAVGFFDEMPVVDAMYTLGAAHPGAMVLHNFPNFLRNLRLPTGELLDMAAVDITKDRERGIPRYNQFRRLLHMRPFKSFEELTPNRAWSAKIKEVYGGDIERVDPLVGMLAETPPNGFGFSDTAFRVFILMASRRLKSDRFFTQDYDPRVYTPEGMRWIEENDMGSVLLRHYPELAPALRGVKNAFAPWNKLPLGQHGRPIPKHRGA